MLDAPELAKRLCAAMDYRDPPLKSVDLAARMGVSKQVVYEWRTTGRIGKGRLVALAEATGMPLEYYLEPERGASPLTRAIWRKLGKLFAKVALIFLALYLPHQNTAEAGAFDINKSCHYCAKALNIMHIVFQWVKACWKLPIFKFS